MAMFRCGSSEGTRIYDLGTNTSFNVSNYSGYNNFTATNFICEPVNLSKKVTTTFTHDGDAGGVSGTAYNNSSYSLSKSYDASTGILQVTSRLVSTVDYAKTAGSDPHVNILGQVHAYLLIK